MRPINRAGVAWTKLTLSTFNFQLMVDVVNGTRKPKS